MKRTPKTLTPSDIAAIGDTVRNIVAKELAELRKKIRKLEKDLKKSQHLCKCHEADLDAAANTIQLRIDAYEELEVKYRALEEENLKLAKELYNP